MIKTSEYIWKRKHFHIWEAFHKKLVPKGHCVTFIDKDYTNFAIENLKCVKRDEYLLGKIKCI